MSIKRRIEQLEQKGRTEKAGVVFYTMAGDKVIKTQTGKADRVLSMSEYKEDLKEQEKKQDIIFIDNISE